MWVFLLQITWLRKILKSLPSILFSVDSKCSQVDKQDYSLHWNTHIPYHLSFFWKCLLTFPNLLWMPFPVMNVSYFLSPKGYVHFLVSWYWYFWPSYLCGDDHYCLLHCPAWTISWGSWEQKISQMERVGHEASGSLLLALCYHPIVCSLICRYLTVLKACNIVFSHVW